MTKKKTDDFDDQIVSVFRCTSQEERAEIARAWCSSYAADLSEYVQRTGLPPIVLIIASLIDVEHPLLVSPGRGLMFSATACAVIALALEINEIPLDSNQVQVLIEHLVRSKFKSTELIHSYEVDAVDECGQIPTLSTGTPIELPKISSYPQVT